MSELRLKSTGTIKLFENDNTSSVTIASPASLGADRTVTLPDGDVTLASGTMPVLTGSTNNTVTTVTGANAIQGEANLTFDGTDLTVSTGNPSIIHDNTTAGGDSGIKFQGSGADYGFINLDNSDGALDLGTSVGWSTRFYTDDSERMRIDSSGNLLVGTTSTTINVSNFGLKIASSGIISSSANVDGASTATEHFGNAGQCRIMGDGDAENTNNSYGALSDERLKENITDANSQWNDIKELQIKNYNLIAYPDRTHIGVIAQDLEADNMSGLVQETKPEVEHIEINSNFGTIEDDTDRPILDDEGNETGIYQQKVKTVNSKVKSVKYSVLYMKAIKAVQEAQTRIETLEAKVAVLEG